MVQDTPKHAVVEAEDTTQENETESEREETTEDGAEESEEEDAE